MTRPSYDLPNYTHRLAALGPLEDEPDETTSDEDLIAERQHIVDRLPREPLNRITYESRLVEIKRLLGRKK